MKTKVWTSSLDWAVALAINILFAVVVLGLGYVLFAPRSALAATSGISANTAWGDIKPTKTLGEVAAAAGLAAKTDVPIAAIESNRVNIASVRVGIESNRVALAGKASKADATLTPIYSDTPTFSEWVCNPATIDGYGVVVVDKSDTIPPQWALEALTIGVVETLPYVEDATTLDFADNDIIATRTRTDIIGFVLGTQADKPLQIAGDYATNAAMETNRVNLASIRVNVESNRIDIASLNDTTSTLSDSISTLNDSISTLSDSIAAPKNYVVSPSADYYYEGSADIPAGRYYRTTTGTGQMGFAAKVPTPRGLLAVTGEADDPVVARFGAEYEIGHGADAVLALSGFVEDGCYAGARLRYDLQGELGLSVSFAANMAVGSASVDAISVAPPEGYVSFYTQDGSEHYLYDFYSVEQTASGATYHYGDECYDSSTGEWDYRERTVTLSYSTTAETGWGYAAFGGTAIATVANIDTARSKLTERVGRPTELGTGWGYKIYDFTDDRRRWELRVPRLTVTTPAVPSRNSSSATTTFAAAGIAKPADAIDDTVWFALPAEANRGLPGNCYGNSAKRVLETRGKYSTDGCRTVDYDVGLLPTDPDAETFESVDDYGLRLLATNITIASSEQPYLWGGVAVEGETEDRLSGERAVKGLALNCTRTFDQPIVAASGGRAVTNDSPRTCSVSWDNFRPTIAISGYTATVTLKYDVACLSEPYYLAGDYTLKRIEGESVHWSSADRTAVFTLRTGASLETVTESAGILVTEYNQHMFWDAGLGCTWQMAVTNGVFFVRKVGTGDYRRKEFVE